MTKMHWRNIFFLIIVLVVIVGGIFFLYGKATFSGPTTQGDQATSTDATLAIGQTATFRDLSLTLNSLVQDSRCPIDVECIQAGTANFNVTLASGGQTETRNMLSSEAPYRFGIYTISIVNTDPARESKKEISPDAYRITFHIAQ